MTPCLSEHDYCSIYRAPLRSAGKSRVCCLARERYDAGELGMEALVRKCLEMKARGEGWHNVYTGKEVGE